MTPEAQRIAIARACPNIVYVCEPDKWGGMGWETFYALGHPKANRPFDPLSDLNAMHEAEKVLTADSRLTYYDHLYRIVEHDLARSKDKYMYVQFAIVHATASQRAEAFLRALNLWDDSK